MEQDNSGKVIWLLTGAALGAALALLYAPQSGADTRRLITRKARESRESLTDASDGLMDRGRELYERGKKMAEDAGELIERGRRVLEG